MHGPDSQRAIEPATIARLYGQLLDELPEEFRPMVQVNRERLLWQVAQVVRVAPPGGQLIDLGAGVVPFMAICQLLGYSTAIVDDYQDATYPSRATVKVVELFERLGVTVIQGNIFDHTSYLPRLPPLDLIVTHDSMEHWHNSPKALFHQLWTTLRQGGVFWVGVPNCVNLRKRITVPFGSGKWSRMEDWYEQPVFRGHVREPDVDDLRYIARDLSASRVEIRGKNWLGYRNSSPIVRRLVPFVDGALQVFPSLCSDIYLFAWK